MRIVCARARERNWNKEGCWRTLNYLICKRCARSTCFMRISREWHGAGHACNRRTTVWVGANHALNRHPEGVTSTQPRASERSDATPWVSNDGGRYAPTGQKQGQERVYRRMMRYMQRIRVSDTAIKPSCRCLCPVGAYRKPIGLTQGVARCARLPWAGSSLPLRGAR